MGVGYREIKLPAGPPLGVSLVRVEFAKFLPSLRRGEVGGGGGGGGALYFTTSFELRVNLFSPLSLFLHHHRVSEEENRHFISPLPSG